MKILITGANGFVGKAITLKLADNKVNKVSVAIRDLAFEFPPNIEVYKHFDLETADWSAVLKDVDIIIHCAARVHVMNEKSNNPIEAFRKVNVNGTLRLANQAASLGVKRFIFLSSLKVNGENTEIGKPFTAEDRPNPLDPYGVSKFEAENGLLKISRESKLEIVIIRPPLVYGPGVKANFLSMLRWLDKSIPLPFGWTENKRSFVALDNLVDLISICCVHQAAKNQIFMVSDGKDLSTTELLRYIGNTLNKKTRLISIHPNIMSFVAKLLGKSGLSQRLLGSLQVDISKNKLLLDWVPPIKVDEALNKTVDYFRKTSN